MYVSEAEWRERGEREQKERAAVRKEVKREQERDEHIDRSQHRSATFCISF